MIRSVKIFLLIKLVPLAKFEFATENLENFCSIQLSYKELSWKAETAEHPSISGYMPPVFDSYAKLSAQID